MARSKRSAVSQIIDVAIIFFMMVVIVVTLYPFYTVIAFSVMSERDMLVPTAFPIPTRLDFTAYIAIFSSGSKLMRGFLISVARVASGVALHLVVTASLAYGLSKKYLPGRGFFINLIVVTMFVGGGLIPYYLLINDLGLMNSFLVMIIPAAVSTWNMIVMRTSFSSIPSTLEESAKLDGANDIRIFVSIVIPISVPLFLAIGLFSAVGHWNSWFDVSLYIKNSNLWPMQMMLKEVLDSASRDWSLLPSGITIKPPTKAVQNATIVVTTLPILMVYPFLQKHFVKGVLIGSIKG